MRVAGAAVLSFLMASVLSSEDLPPFQRGDVVLRTYPSLGLNPSMKSWTVTWVTSDASELRTLAFNGILSDMRLLAPAFDPRCSLEAVRAIGGAYDLVSIGADGTVTRRYLLDLPAVPSRMFIDRRGIHYIAVQPFVPPPYDMLILDAGGSLIDRIDLPNAFGVSGFDVAADGCAIIYTTGTGVARFDICSHMPIGKEVPTGGVYDVRLLPDGGFLTGGAAINRFDARGMLVETYGAGLFSSGWQSVAVAPDGQSFWAANPLLYRFALDRPSDRIVDGKFVPGAIKVDGMTVCGDWRAPLKRRSIRPAALPRGWPTPPP